MDQQLADLVQKKQKQAGNGAPINWDERRDKYVASVNELYTQIEGILAEAIGQNKVTRQRRQKQLAESHIGTYAIDDLILIIGSEQVRLSPRGRNIAAAEGRVDVIGERGEAVLILQGDSDWGFVQSRQPKVTIIPFNEASFAEVLRLVMRE